MYDEENVYMRSLGGDVEENLQKVKQYTKYALVCGTARSCRISMQNV